MEGGRPCLTPPTPFPPPHRIFWTCQGLPGPQLAGGQRLKLYLGASESLSAHIPTQPLHSCPQGPSLEGATSPPSHPHPHPHPHPGPQPWPPRGAGQDVSGSGSSTGYFHRCLPRPAPSSACGLWTSQALWFPPPGLMPQPLSGLCASATPTPGGRPIPGGLPPLPPPVPAGNFIQCS